jgi:hypothetical protein
MGADNSSNIESKKAPALVRVTEKNLLADAPSQPPKYPVTVKTADGNHMVLGNPDVTRGQWMAVRPAIGEVAQPLPK